MNTSTCLSAALMMVLAAVAMAEPGIDGVSQVDDGGAGRVGPVGDDNGQAHACTGTQAGFAVLCVRAGAAPGGTGTAAAPYASINAAISAAKAGDVVQVAVGNYAENVALGSFASPASKHLSLLGGFDVGFSARDAGQYPTVINGGQINPAVQLHVNSSQVTTLDGFVLTGGVGLGTSWQDGNGHGGGVYAQVLGDGRVVISHNVIHGNRTRNHTSADSRGGGVHASVATWSSPLGLVRIEDNHIHDNEAGKGSGINISGRAAIVLRNRVDDNTSHHDHGGGIYVSTGNTQVRHNLIRGNVVGATQGYGWGGGIIIAAAGADLEGNLITDNYTPTTGSGVFWDEGAVGTMKNDRIVRNRCPLGSRSGAAIYVDGGPGGPSHVVIENVTIADHDCPGTAPSGAAVVIEDGSSASFRNSILWGNTRDFATLSGGSFTVVWSLTQEAGQGNWHADPLFADAATGDYHLRSQSGRYTPSGWVLDAVTSPAIDAGDPASSFALESQPNGGRINLGAYGNTAEASRSPGSDQIFANGFD